MLFTVNQVNEFMGVHFLLTQDLSSPSGGGRYWLLAAELARLGFQVRISALHSSFSEIEQKTFEMDGVQVEYVAQMHVRKSGSGKTYFSFWSLVKVTLQATWKLSKAALLSNARIIHIGKPHPMNGFAGLLAKILKGKTIYLDCDDDETGSNRFGGAWQRRVIAFWERNLPRWVDLVTSNTYTSIKRLKSWGIPQEKIVYLPNGVNPERFMAFNPERVASLRRDLKLDDAPVVAYIGSLSLANHPVDILIKAFQKVHAQIPGAILLVVGGGQDLQKLKDQAQELGVSGSVRFIGRVAMQEVVDYYQLATLTVDPALDDAASRGRSPLKLFESWAAGIPFVSSAVGDRVLLAGDPPAAYLTQTGDPDSLADAIVTIIHDPGLCKELAKRGLDRVKEYDWKKIAAQIQWIYQNEQHFQS